MCRNIENSARARLFSNRVILFQGERDMLRSIQYVPGFSPLGRQRRDAGPGSPILAWQNGRSKIFIKFRVEAKSISRS